MMLPIGGIHLFIQDADTTTHASPPGESHKNNIPTNKKNLTFSPPPPAFPPSRRPHAPIQADFLLRLPRGRPRARRVRTSPSASHLQALTSWTTLMICLRAMTGKLTPARTQGQKLSILLARASSSAPALYGFVKICRSSDELTCAPRCTASAASPAAAPGPACGCSSDGERSGDEKDSRYSAMKKASLSAQATKRTFWEREKASLVRRRRRRGY